MAESLQAEPRWRIGVDVGGTFADCVAVTPHGEWRRLKLLTNGWKRVAWVDGRVDLPEWSLGALVGATAVAPDGARSVVEAVDGRVIRLREALPPCPWIELGSGEEAPVWGARLLTGTAVSAYLPRLVLHLSTTRGTNALLEGDGGDVGVILNEGLEGVVEIGTQQRLGIFDLAPRKPPLLAKVMIGVRGRIAADGAELEALDVASVDRAIAHLRAAGVRHVAIALLHSWRNPAHERAVAEIVRRAGFDSVCTSCELAAVPRLVPRAQTAVVEARLHGPVREYLGRVMEALSGDGCGGGPGRGVFRVGTSAGGVVAAAKFRAKDSLLSGPAAGCAGAVAAMRAAGVARAVTLDIGGTSTDVARIDEHGVGLRFETVVAGSAVATPSFDVHSVAAGGGSICEATSTGLFVGPRSAGASPGPACYGRGGPLTLTDVNLLLGRLWAEGSSLPLDSAAAMAAAEVQAERSGRELRAMLHGFLEVAHEHTAAAVRAVSTSAGHDPRSHVLLAFGGAGGQLACAVAARLGMSKVLMVPNAGFLSARGVFAAQLERTAEEAVMVPLGDGVALRDALGRARARAQEALKADGAERTRAARVVAVMRAPGRAGTIAVDVDAALSAAECAMQARKAFQNRMRALGDPAFAEEPELDSVRVVEAGVGVGSSLDAGSASKPASAGAVRSASAAPFAWVESPLSGVRVAVWKWGELGSRVAGPAIIVDEGATVVVDAGWSAGEAPGGGIMLVRDASLTVSDERDSAVDLEVAAARFIGIGAWMGVCLERAAKSVNVKERLDFSCGILDAKGRLVANAPHIPVHLGALGMCVRSVLRRVRIGSGEFALTNDPRHGGSHLPDLTLVRAVHADDGTLLGYVAARAHHAEVGGITPGSMPPNAKSLAEEGVLIDPRIVGRGGEIDENAVRAAMSAGAYPSRDPESNLADIRAAAAALNAGAEAIRALAAERSVAATLNAMERLLERSAAHVRGLTRQLAPRGALKATERLDDGHAITVGIVPHANGTMDVAIDAPGIHPLPFNAPESVTRSAILYVLRVLAARAANPPLDDHVAPLNEGFLAPVRITVSPGFLNAFPESSSSDAAALPPVFAGNTESSQRLVDALLLAFHAAACSQGTMNNLVFGNDKFSVYETIGGGAGACEGSHGASSIHVHMSNTRLTDPETLELRHPVRLERLQVRAGSGGTGRWHGGCGTIRRIRMLAPVELSFIGQHRVELPKGLAGGGDGAPGEQRILRSDGSVEAVAGVFAAKLAVGDAIEIATPGGGGYGK